MIKNKKKITIMKYIILLLLLLLVGCSSVEYNVYDSVTKNPVKDALVLIYNRNTPEHVVACVSDANGKFFIKSEPDIILVGKNGFALEAVGKYSSKNIYLNGIEKRIEQMKNNLNHYDHNNKILLPIFLLNKLPTNSNYYKDWKEYTQYLKTQYKR